MRRKIELTSSTVELVRGNRPRERPYMHLQSSLSSTISRCPEEPQYLFRESLHKPAYENILHDAHSSPSFSPSISEEAPASSTPDLSNENTSSVSENGLIVLPTPSQECETISNEEFCYAEENQHEMSLERARYERWANEEKSCGAINHVSDEEEYSTCSQDDRSLSNGFPRNHEWLQNSPITATDASKVGSEIRTTLKRLRHDSWTSDTTDNSDMSGVETEVDINSWNGSEIGLSPRSFVTTHDIPRLPPKRQKRINSNGSLSDERVKPASERLAASLNSSACSSFDSSNPAHSSLLPKALLVTALPIIAPPEYSLIPRAPLTPDDAAEARLKNLLSREKLCREEDRLSSGMSSDIVSCNNIQSVFGVEHSFWLQVTKWLIDVSSIGVFMYWRGDVCAFSGPTVQKGSPY